MSEKEINAKYLEIMKGYDRAIKLYDKRTKLLDKQLVELQKECDHPVSKLDLDIDPAGGPSELYCGVCKKRIR